MNKRNKVAERLLDLADELETKDFAFEDAKVVQTAVLELHKAAGLLRKKKKNGIVTYTGHDEVLVTTEDDEKKMLAEYFAADTGRDPIGYDRDGPDIMRPHTTVVISSPFRVEFE